MKATYKKEVTAKELAELTGEPYSTIDYWTTMGLLKPHIRGRTRIYNTEKSIKRRNKIRELQNEKMPIELIRKQLNQSFG